MMPVPAWAGQRHAPTCAAPTPLALVCCCCRNRLMALAAAHHSSAQIIKSTSLSARSNVREIVRSLKLEGVVEECGNGSGKVEV